MKKMAFVFVIVLIAIIGCGCAEVTYTTYNTSAGGRIMEWTVTLEQAEINKAKSFIDVKQEVIDFLQEEADRRLAQGRNAEVIIDADNPLKITLRESYDSLSEMYAIYGYT
ncbi:MAG: hypothetical protein EOM87_09120, partial [Clostridia bacterium]|nr:hypothetical protein [Clostridia bacterium]